MFKVLTLLHLLGAASVAIASGNCDITGLDKVAVVRALWEVSFVAPAAYRFTPDLAIKKEISDEDIQKALSQQGGFIDYLNCRLIKADFHGNSFNTNPYNDTNGVGAAERIIAALRTIKEKKSFEK